jgi:homoserine kinase type II
LTVDELAYLPHLINAGNIYILYWTLRDYFGKDVDPQKYLIFLKHGVAFAHWFSEPSQRRDLMAMLENLPRA